MRRSIAGSAGDRNQRCRPLHDFTYSNTIRDGIFVTGVADRTPQFPQGAPLHRVIRSRNGLGLSGRGPLGHEDDHMPAGERSVAVRVVRDELCDAEAVALEDRSRLLDRVGLA
jgi:hypothetical protein